MDKSEILRQMIAEKQRLIELYQAMIADWEKELGIATTGPSANQAGDSGTKTSAKPGSGGDLLGLVREYEFFRKSQPEAAKAFLEKVGHPVKTQVILEAIQKGGLTVGGKEESKRLNLYTILHRSADFGLAGKDAWGLVGWPGVAKKEKETNGDAATEKKEKEKRSPSPIRSKTGPQGVAAPKDPLNQVSFCGEDKHSEVLAGSFSFYSRPTNKQRAFLRGFQPRKDAPFYVVTVAQAG